MRMFIVALILCTACISCDIIQPIRKSDGKGATDFGPRNSVIDRINVEQFIPPATDSGKFPNLKYSFSYSHMRLQSGGWTREITVKDLPTSATLAGVNMRLKPGAVRELHWHKEAEWGYVLYGTCRITAVDTEGRNFIDDTGVGDIWYFPSGIPHSIQGLADDGCEFALIFDDGNFSEDSTFLVADWITHTPPEILEKNFGFEKGAFNNTPKEELYIFQDVVPGSISEEEIKSPKGKVKSPFSHRMLAQEPIRTKMGTARITDSRNFEVSKTIAAALVEVYPKGLRELHWHPDADEWTYVITGTGRMTVFAAEGKSRTYGLSAGDVAYIPKSMGHYIENTGDTTMTFLEVFKAKEFSDISLNQWLALTPKNLVRAHTRLSKENIDKLNKVKLLLQL